MGLAFDARNNLYGTQQALNSPLFTIDFANHAVNVVGHTGLDILHGGDIAPIPEPETYAMLLAGLGALTFAARRRKPGAA